MYTPNFNDPRVSKRIKKAIGFVSALVSEDTPRWLSTRYIDKHLGSQRNDLSKFLRNSLLICTDETYDMYQKKCKEYVLNKKGLENITASVNGNKHTHITYPTVVDVIEQAIEWGKDTYEEQLTSLNFEYVEKSHRLCNDIQSIRSDARSKLLANYGLKYNYDIETCAPTLLYQYSFKTPSATGEVCSVIENYINNKEYIRNKLSIESGLPVANIKKIINAMFSGGFLTSYKDSAVFKLCNKDVSIVKFLQQHQFILGLKADIVTMWGPIKADTPPEYYWTKTNKYRKRPFCPRNKWNIYFQLERKVLNEVIKYCNELNTKYFLEHDGFRTQVKIDTDDLSTYIEYGLGYQLKFKEALQ